MRADEPLYTARVDNHGGTSGQVRVHDGPADAAAAAPPTTPTTRTTGEVTLPTGGPSTPSQGFNPEQFLAMAWSTCLAETLRAVLAERGLAQESSVSVEVELHRDPEGGYRFVPRALVSLEQVPAEQAREIAQAAHARCPVSKLLSGQGDPVLELVEHQPAR